LCGGGHWHGKSGKRKQFLFLARPNNEEKNTYDHDWLSITIFKYTFVAIHKQWMVSTNKEIRILLSRLKNCPSGTQIYPNICRSDWKCVTTTWQCRKLPRLELKISKCCLSYYVNGNDPLSRQGLLQNQRNVKKL